MVLVGLIGVVCCLVLLAFTVPVALVTLGAIASWLWSSGALAILAIVAVVIPVLVWLDPRERALQKQHREEELKLARTHLLNALGRRPAE